MDQIKEHLETGQHVSSLLLDNALRGPIQIPKEDPYTTIVGILLLLDLISKLGWVEHTSDWDLGMLIINQAGETIEVPQGYADCLSLHDNSGREIKKYSFLLPQMNKLFTLQLTEDSCHDHCQGDCDFDENLKPFSINIWDIKSIEIYR